MSEFLERGKRLHQSALVDEAVEAFRQAAAAEPENIEAHLRLANALAEQARWQEAAESYHRALEIDPQSAPAHYNFGNALLAQCRIAAAAEEYLRTIEIDSSHRNAQMNLGTAYGELGRWEEAVACYRRVLGPDPSKPDPKASYNLGRALHALGRLDEAIETYRAATQALPDFEPADHSLVAALFQAGRSQEGIEAHRKIMDRHPDDPAVHVRLGLTLQGNGLTDQAERSLRRALELHPRSSLVYSTLGSLLRDLGRMDECAALVDQWLQACPDDATALHMKAAWTGRDAPARASDNYVRQLFDGFAPDYDEVLAALNHRGPGLTSEMFRQCFPDRRGGLDILDAGCGTGLSGPLLRPLARRLIGVDLSSRMLERARRRGTYDDLIEADVTSYLSRGPAIYDLIVASDTLCYFGDLRPIFGAAATALRNGGALVFTVEETGEDFRLAATGRYSHSEKYVLRELAAAGLTALGNERSVLRTEHRKPVPGLVVAAVKTADSSGAGEPCRPTGAGQPTVDDGKTLFESATLEMQRGQPRKAAAILERLVALQPANLRARHELAMLLAQLGQPRLALPHAEEAARLQPRSMEIVNNLGGLLEQVGRIDEAIQCYRQAAALAPSLAVPHFNLGDALRQVGRLDEAIAVLRNAALLDPNLQEAWASLGAALLLAGQAEIAMGPLQRAVDLRPADHQSRRKLADALQSLEKFAEAVPLYEQAIKQAPRSIDAWYGLGRALVGCGRVLDASRAFRQCVEIDPNCALAVQDLGKTLFELGSIEQAMPLLRRGSEMGPEEVRARALENLALIVPGSPLDDNQSILQTRRAWGRWLASQTAAVMPARAKTRSPRPVRIGYVSSFFHCRNWMKPVWALVNHHDRDQFEIHLFSDSPAEEIRDSYRPRPADRIHDISQQSNASAADLIARQDVDILVDLNGYSALQRLGIYPFRPAPVLIGWFNMYAPSGLDCFDYLIGDGQVIPEREEQFYTERILRVPHTYLAFEVDYPVPDVAPAPSHQAGHVTVGCLASHYKITEEVLRTWAEILRRAPGARMLLRNASMERPENQAHLAERLAAYGVARQRLTLEGRAEHFEFLETYGRVDVAVDPFPYSGGTTTMEALWQGVPVVTFSGDRWASRTSASLLHAAGLDEFIARDREEYIELAVRLATSPDTPPRLESFRQDIRQRLRASPVCDAASFARAMERIYREVLKAS